MPAVACAQAAPTEDTSASALPTYDASRHDDERARSHFQVARDYFGDARYEEAAEQFAEAYRLSGRVELLVNLSLSYERLLRYADAIAVLDAYLARAPLDEPRRAESAERRARLAAILASAEQPRPVETLVEPVAPTESSPSTLTTVGIATTSVGAALLLGALGTGVGAFVIHEDLASACPDGACPASRAGDISTGRALGDTSTVLTFVGAGVAAVGAVLWVVGSGESSTREQAPVAIVVTPELGAVSVQGVW